MSGARLFLFLFLFFGLSFLSASNRYCFFCNSLVVHNCTETEGFYLITQTDSSAISVYRPVTVSKFRETSYLNPVISSLPKPDIFVRNGTCTLANPSCKTSIRLWPKFIAQLYHPTIVHYSGTFLEYLHTAPVTLFIGIALVIIWFYCWNYKVDVSTVGICYNSIYKNHELARIFTASFSHLDLFHIAMNVSSLFSLTSVEIHYGSVHYIFLSLWLIVFTMIFTLQFQKWSRNEQSLSSWGVGYSCVLFALMTIHVVVSNNTISFFGIQFRTYHLTPLSIPFNFYPFAQLVFMKILVRNSSFYGHLSGILLGFVVSVIPSSIQSPMMYCLSVFLAFYLFEKKWKSDLSIQNSGVINHMVDSSTNVKYLIVHNFAFILLFCLTVIIFFWSAFDSFRVFHLDGIAYGFAGWLVCREIKQYTKTSLVPGLLVLLLIMSITELLCISYELVYAISFGIPYNSDSIHFTHCIILLICSSVEVFCIVHLMSCLESSYPTWFLRILNYLTNMSSRSQRIVSKGFIFKRQSLSNNEP